MKKTGRMKIGTAGMKYSSKTESKNRPKDFNNNLCIIDSNFIKLDKKSIIWSSDNASTFCIPLSVSKCLKEIY